MVSSLLKAWTSNFLSVSVSQLIEQLKEEIPILLSEVEHMYAEVWNPREAVFKDVLLQRPKYVVSAAMLG